MKQISIFDFYSLGKVLQELSVLSNITAETPFTDVIWPLWTARYTLDQLVTENPVLLDSSRRAVKNLVIAINALLPVDEELWGVDHKGKTVNSYFAAGITTAWKNFETVFSNDVPATPTFVVVQKGIYRTEDLIDRGHNHLPRGLREQLFPQVEVDIMQSGRCLAFEVPTASAFHMWRAVESAMDSYHTAITGKTFKDADPKISRNWASYIQALDKAGADKKVTSFLDHIREEYRNPIAHPSANTDLEEAFMLFGTGLSAIAQMAVAIKGLAVNNTPKPIPPIASAVALPEAI
jgi:hypothetical protein